MLNGYADVVAFSTKTLKPLFSMLRKLERTSIRCINGRHILNWTHIY